MPHLKYQIQKRFTRLISKHYRGFGIDSPYVYYLVREIIEAKMHYYPFKKLERQGRNILSEIEEKLQVDDLDENEYLWLEAESQYLKECDKLNRLLFRLVNFIQPSRLALMGNDSGLALSYLAKVDSRRIVHCLNSNAFACHFSQNVLNENRITNVDYSNLENSHSFDFIHISRSIEADVLKIFETDIDRYLNENSFLVVENINKDERMHLFWNRLKSMKRFNVSLDLFEVGILIARNGLKKQDYILSVNAYK